MSMRSGGLHRRALWRTRPYLRPYARHMTIIVFSSVMSSAFQVALPLIVKTVIDGPLHDGDRRGIVMWGLVAGALAVFGVLLTLHVGLTLLTFVATIPVVLLCRKFERDYHEIVRDIQDQTGDLTTTIEEGARGIRVLKAFGRGREAFAAYDEQSVRLYKTQLARIKLHTKFVWVLGLIPNLTLTAVLLAGVIAVGSGSLTVGGLVAFVSYVLMLTFPLEILGWIMAMAGEAESAAVRVYEVLDTEPMITDRPGAITIEHAHGDVRFENV